MASILDSNPGTLVSAKTALPTVRLALNFNDTTDDRLK